MNSRWPPQLAPAILGALIALSAGVWSAPARAAVGDPIELAFQAAEVREVFASLADLAGWNFMVLPEVTGTVTLSLAGLTVEEAVDLLARTTGYGYVRQGRTLVVGARENLAGRFGAAAVRPQPAESQEAERVELFRLDYAPAERVRDVLTMWIPEERIRLDSSGNLLAVRGREEELARVRELVAAYDRPPQQVVIEARIEEVQRDAVDELGFTWPLPSVGVSLNPTFGTIDLEPDQLLARLEALESQGLSRLLARPRVATLDGRTASIFIGDEIPVILKGQADAPDTIETISAGIRLEITPQVSREGQVTVQVNTEVSSITGFRSTAEGQELPQIRTRQAETKVRVRDGQPIVIGGLISRTDGETRTGLPVLREFPVIGGIFSRDRSDRTDTEMLIFLIPRLELLDAGGSEGDGPSRTAPTNPGVSPTQEGEARGGELRGLPWPAEPARPLTLRTSLSEASKSAWQLSLERPVGDAQAAATSLVALPLPGSAELAWGIGLDWRWYEPVGDTRLWLELGSEALWVPQGSHRPPASVALLKAGVGLQARGPAKDLRVEPYLRWIPDLGPDLPELIAPGHRPGTSIGLNVGLEF